MSTSTYGRGMVIGLLIWTAKMAFELAGLLIVWAVKALAWCTVRAVRHPRTSLGAGLLAGSVYLLGWPAVVSVIGVAFLAASTWKAADRDSFDRLLGQWLDQWWRRWWVYKRTWSKVMSRAGLTVEIDRRGQDTEKLTPQLQEISQARYWDRLVVGLLDGQELDDYRQAAERLRHAFGAERVSVREIQPKKVGVDLMRRDPFRFEVIPATAIPATVDEVDFRAIPIGLDEHLEPLTMSLLGGHTVGSGAPNAGKASLEHNVLRGIAPAWAAGLVRPVFIDPKQQELRQYAHLIPEEDYAATAKDTIALLQREVAEMGEVGKALGTAGERDFEPSVEFPLRLILVDELAALLKYWSRGDVSKCEDALGALCAFGRSAGRIVIGCIQEPTKDVFRIRDLFARKIALRLPTPDAVEAALVDQAVKRGGRAHEIPESLPGVAYTFADGQQFATRFRFGHAAGAEQVAELVDYMEAARVVTPINSRRGGASEAEAA